jgi:hypothetical protein
LVLEFVKRAGDSGGAQNCHQNNDKQSAYASQISQKIWKHDQAGARNNYASADEF